MLAHVRFIVIASSMVFACPIAIQAVEATDEATVRQVALDIVAADNARDLTRVLAHYDDDAVLLPPNESPVYGKQAIRARYVSLFSEYTPEIVNEIMEVHVEGQLAFIIGHTGGRLLSTTESDPKVLNDIYIMILTRSAPASWQIARLMWHSAGPAVLNRPDP